MVVSKFGGTSMGDAFCMRRSALLCWKQSSKLVVVSATSGTTNQLISLGRSAESLDWKTAEELLLKVEIGIWPLRLSFSVQRNFESHQRSFDGNEVFGFGHSLAQRLLVESDGCFDELWRTAF